MGKTRDHFKKIRDTQGTFLAKIGSIKNRHGTDLTDRVPDELWTEVHDIVQETGINTIPMEKMSKSKRAVWGGVTISCKKTRSEKHRGKGKI